MSYMHGGATYLEIIESASAVMDAHQIVVPWPVANSNKDNGQREMTINRNRGCIISKLFYGLVASQSNNNQIIFSYFFYEIGIFYQHLF
jgi:hypothetical protein